MTGHSGGEHIRQALTTLEVDRIFTIASVHNLPVLEAIATHGGIEVVNVRHEQAAVHAADGYARATGRLGVAVTSTGPGAANAMGGLFEASFASSPVLMVTGQIESRFQGQGRGFLHEAEHQADMLRTVTKAVWSVRRACDIGDAVLAAGRHALSGRRGPTAVEIPIDLQYQSLAIDAPVAPPLRRTPPAHDRVHAAAELLAAARRPLIWAGGGVVGSEAGEALRTLVERLRIPVVTSTQGRGSLSEDHQLCLGALAASAPLRDLVESADVMLAVGTRFQMYSTAFWKLRLPEALIHVDVDPSVIGRSYQPAVSVVADAGLALSAIDGAVVSGNAEADWAQRCVAAAEQTRASALAALGPDHSRLVDVIRRHLPRGGAVVRDATVPAYNWGDRLLPILEPRTSLNPTGAAIGPGLPLALGATMGRGERSVVIHGDGGIMLTIAELATLAQFDVPLTVCVFNDRGYGILRGIQSATFGGGQHDVDLATPDFVRLAESMQVPGERVGTVEAFEKAFMTSVRAAGPYLIEVDLNALAPMAVTIGAQELLT